MTGNSEMEESSVAAEKTSSNNPLEQFVLLAKTAKGAAALQLVKQAIEAPGVNVFGELLDMPNIKELKNGAHGPYWNTLNLFAYGTYKEYLENKDNFLELTATQKKKLQHLTIVTLAEKSKCIPYSVLLTELGIDNVRELEDLIIEAVYADIINGKLDHKNSQLEVDYAGLGRDVKPGETGAVMETLEAWGQTCEKVLACIEQQVITANNDKRVATAHKEQVQQDIANIKKSLLAQAGGGGVQEADVAGGSSAAGSESTREAMSLSTDMKKKPQKSKGIRDRSKFWKT
ncbi:COP9 signalosome complex subunit 7b [Microplitis demolitor]|uniref:COP9 signalosome complex subunit 7b n=1 Tax=Microplitis demolitor TaxID=69319 RepID=UPI0006D4CC14|nr:COP9 signalosome complex subunit 7b [Microplitis demolitor]